MMILSENILKKFFLVRRLINLIAIEEFKDLNMSPKKAAVLRIIKDYPKISLSSIALFTASDPSTITRMIDDLAKNNLVIKTLSKDDRRFFSVNLSEDGEKKSENY